MNLKDYLPQNLNAIIGRVSYPVLSTLQDDIPRLRNNYQKADPFSDVYHFYFDVGEWLQWAEPMIHTLIGAKWEAAIIYLQMLCFCGYDVSVACLEC